MAVRRHPCQDDRQGDCRRPQSEHRAGEMQTGERVLARNSPTTQAQAKARHAGREGHTGRDVSRS